MTLAWVLLMAAGIFEIAGAISLKLCEGFTRPLWSAGLFVFMGLSLYLLTLALESIPLGTAYAIWTGIGAMGTALIGMARFGESVNLGRIASLVLVVAGAMGMKLFSA